jgi:hypothetical protein
MSAAVYSAGPLIDMGTRSVEHAAPHGRNEWNAMSLSMRCETT